MISKAGVLAMATRLIGTFQMLPKTEGGNLLFADTNWEEHHRVLNHLSYKKHFNDKNQYFNGLI